MVHALTARRSMGVAVVWLVAASSWACAPGASEDDRRALGAELAANRDALVMLGDTLMQHANIASYYLSWAEEVEPAGSGTLWDIMKILRRRPAFRGGHAAYDDLVQRGLLDDVVPEGEPRRRLIAFYDLVQRMDRVAEAEYRRLAEHYEQVLGPGEWRNVFEVELGEHGFAVDYRTNVQALVAENHEAVLRALIRGQAEYIRATAEARREADALILELGAK